MSDTEKPQGVPKRIWIQLTEEQRNQYFAAAGGSVEALNDLLKSLFPIEPESTFYG